MIRSTSQLPKAAAGAHALIDISQLEVRRDGKTICAVEKLAVESGQRIAVVGANGSGKTTLLRILAGLDADFEGRCRVEVGHRRRTYLHQHPYLFRGTVLANVAYAEQGRAAQRSTAADWLARLGVEHLAHRTTQNLSGGETRRVALARSLACRPRLLLLDEPLADLDPQAAETVCQVLLELPETTIVIASPDVPPASLATTVYHLANRENAT